MKKIVLLFVGMLCLLALTSAQDIVDNAVKATGVHELHHTYIGNGWLHGATTPTFYKSTFSASNVANAYVTFSFHGNKIEWYTEKKNTHGIVAISIDGGAETLIDLYSTTEQHILVYTSPSTLTEASHIVKIRATGTKNPASTNYWLIHDYFTVYSELLPTALVHLKFDELQGSNPVNYGAASALFLRSGSVPTSVAANVPGAYDFGTTPGNYYVESASPIDDLKNLSAFTITGWVNCKSNIAGSGGNRIISWINNGGQGVDLVYQSDGSLRLGVNGWPDASPAVSSPNKVTTNASAPSQNWKFFAVTYQSNGQVQFYFGNLGGFLTLDVTRSYPGRGAAGSAIGKLAIGAFNSATRNAGTYDRQFRGIIDDIQVYRSVLSSDQIARAQAANRDLVPPTAPAALTAVNVTETTATLYWGGSSDSLGRIKYNIYLNNSVIASTTRLDITIPNLTPSTIYSFYVRATDNASNQSAPSNTVGVLTLPGVDTSPPTAPTNVRVTEVTPTTITLAWNPSTDNVGVNRYNIYNNNSLLASLLTGTLPPNTPLTIRLSNLITPNTTYSLDVRAQDAASNVSAPSNVVTVTTNADPTPPSTPTNLVVVSKTDRTVFLNWNLSTDNVGVKWYHVFVNNSFYGEMPSPSYGLLSNLNPGTTYDIYLKAIDAAGNYSLPSNTVTVTLDEDTTPPTPPRAKLTFRTSTSISLLISPGDFEVDIVRYVVSANNQQYYVPYEVNGESNFIIPNLAPSTTYSVTVQAQDASGNTSELASILVTTLPAERPLIRLVLNDADGTNTAVQNYGSLNSSFVRSQPSPFSSSLPVHNVLPASFNWGTTPSNYYVESTGVIDGLKNLSSFTLVGWVNNNSTTSGSGGNRIISWINNGGDGVDLVYQSNGSLRLGVDGWPDNSPAVSSPGKVTTTTRGDQYTSNWTFFAVTYQSNGQVQFYFGDYDEEAALDVTRIYAGRGAVGSNIGRLALGNFNSATRNPSTYDRMFRGSMADIQIYGSVLSFADILHVQGLTSSESFATRSSTTTARSAALVVDEESEIKDELYQNFPNPYSDETVIEISLRRSVQVANIMLMDLNGRELKNIEVVERGKTSVTVNGGDLNAGMYFYRLMTDGKIADTKRMVLIK